MAPVVLVVPVELVAPVVLVGPVELATVPVAVLLEVELTAGEEWLEPQAEIDKAAASAARPNLVDTVGSLPNASLAPDGRIGN